MPTPNKTTICVLLLSFFFASFAKADLLSYSVDLLGEVKDQGTAGHVLRVFGQIIVDTDAPLHKSVLSSNLFLQHEDDAPIQLPSIPEYNPAPPLLDWIVKGDSLYIRRISGGNVSQISWSDPNDPLRFFILEQNPSRSHRLVYRESGTNVDVVSLFPNIPGDFLVGTALLPGDLNCDGTIDLLDVNPFVKLLSSSTYNIKADINCDGQLDLLDVQPFVELILN